MKYVPLCRSLLATALLLGPAHALAADPTHVPSANPKSPGVVAPNVLSPELAAVIRAQGAMLLENPVSPAKYPRHRDRRQGPVRRQQAGEGQDGGGPRAAAGSPGGHRSVLSSC